MRRGNGRSKERSASIDSTEGLRVSSDLHIGEYVLVWSTIAAEVNVLVVVSHVEAPSRNDMTSLGIRAYYPDPRDALCLEMRAVWSVSCGRQQTEVSLR